MLADESSLEIVGQALSPEQDSLGAVVTGFMGHFHLWGKLHVNRILGLFCDSMICIPQSRGRTRLLSHRSRCW